MKKIVLAAAAAMLAAFAAFAAPPADNVASTPTPPTGACRDAAPLVLSRSNGHLYGCVSGAWHDWTAAMLAGISVNSIVGDVTIDGSLAVTGSLTAPSFKGEVDLTSDPSYPSGLLRDGSGFTARANGGGYVTLKPGALEAGSWAGDVNIRSAYGSVRVTGTTLAPLHNGGTVDLGTATDPFQTVYVSGVDLDADGTLDLGATSKTKFFHGTADMASKLGGYYPSDFALASALSGYVPTTQKGAANGVASLGGDGKIPAGQLPVVSPLTTKGDLYGYDGSASARVPAGGDGSLLIADSAQSTGLAYRSVDWIQRGTVDGVPVGILPQSDEFSDATLNAKWSNPCPGNFDVVGPSNGALVLTRRYGAAGGLSGVYEAAPAGDFAVVFKLNYFSRSAGVGVFSALGASDGLSISFGTGFDGNAPTRVSQDNGTTFPAVCGGGGGGSDDGALTLGSGPAGYYFALEKVGTSWSTYYSADGVSWTMFSTTKSLPSFVPAYIAVWTYDKYSTWLSSISLDFLRVAPSKNSFGVKSYYLASYTGPFHFTGSDLRADDTTSRQGVFAANGPVKLWSDQNNDAAEDRHVRVYHAGAAAPQVDFDGSTNTAKFDLDSDGTTDYTFAKPAAACASGMEMAVNASGQVVCKARSPIVLYPPLGSCDNGGNYSRGAWSSTGAVAFACEDVRGFYKHPYFEYPDSSSNVMAYSFLAPDNWDGTLTITLWWSGSQTSGAVRWFEGHDCFASGSTFYSQPTTTATVDSTAAGTANKQTAVALSVTGLSSCAGGMTTILVGRDGTHANDTYTGAVQVNGIKIALGAK